MKTNYKRTVILTSLTILMGSGVVQAKKFNSNFNKNNGFFFAVDNLFTNEKQGMDVNYKKANVSRAGGFLTLKSKKVKGDSVTGSWVRTGLMFPSGSASQCGCLIKPAKGQANTKNNWTGFWTLYNKSNALKDNKQYYENDVMETYDKGNFVNRYTKTNYKTNKLIIGKGESNTFTSAGVFNLRNKYNTYKLNWNAKKSIFVLGGEVKKTIKGATRNGKHKILVVNRPWPSRLGKINNGQFIANYAVDFVNTETP